MGKGKKGGKRMNKAQLTEMLQEFFAERPGEVLSFKEIFRSLHLTTHPLKMLAIDIMEEMAWDDYLAKVSDNSYRLNQSVQVMEGKFVRKANGKNSVIPDDSETQFDGSSQWRPGGIHLPGKTQKPHQGGASQQDFGTCEGYLRGTTQG